MILEYFKKIFGKKDEKTIKTYEECLYEEYGNCNPLEKHISIFFIADTHNCLGYNEDKIKELEQGNNCDCCILLGDHSASDLSAITKVITKCPIYGVLGNHDHLGLYDNFNITDINGKVIEIRGVKIAGLSGSFKYKNSPYSALYTHEESIDITNRMENCDIFVSHDKPFLQDSEDIVHNGLKGITNYIYKNKVPIHIHGHLHTDNVEYLKNGTKSITVYGMKKIDL